MARARLIKPGFYSNEQLAECSILARLIFPGLWMLADRRGRLEDRPKRIKGALLPYDDGDVDALLTELSNHGFILRYRVDGKPLIQILGFEKHQHCHVHEQESTLPAPEMHGASTVQAPVIHPSPPAEAEAFKPLTEAVIKPSREQNPLAIPDWLAAEDWERWRKHRGAKFKTETAKLHLAKLRLLHGEGHEARTLIDLAIENSWATFWPPKVRDPPRKPTTLAERRNSTLDAITGGNRERDITGTAQRVDSANIHPITVDVRQQDGDDVGDCGPKRLAAGVG